MENNFKPKNQILEFFHENYPKAVEIEFDFVIDAGLVSSFNNLKWKDPNLNVHLIESLPNWK